MAARAVAFDSINVAASADGAAELRRLGLRGLPVVARGDAGISGTNLADVAALAGLSYDSTPQLAPAQLVESFVTVLRASMRFAKQIPAERLSDKLPHRDRSYVALANHAIEIAASFLAVAAGEPFVGDLAASLPDSPRSIPDLGAHAATQIAALQRWMAAAPVDVLQRETRTYYGSQTLHQVLERCTWHCAQHARQLMMVLELLGLSADEPLTDATFAGLPMPQAVWDG